MCCVPVVYLLCTCVLGVCVLYIVCWPHACVRTGGGGVVYHPVPLYAPRLPPILSETHAGVGHVAAIIAKRLFAEGWHEIEVRLDRFIVLVALLR